MDQGSKLFKKLKHNFGIIHTIKAGRYSTPPTFHGNKLFSVVHYQSSDSKKAYLYRTLLSFINQFDQAVLKDTE